MDRTADKLLQPVAVNPSMVTDLRPSNHIMVSSVEALMLSSRLSRKMKSMD